MRGEGQAKASWEAGAIMLLRDKDSLDHRGHSGSGLAYQTNTYGNYKNGKLP